MNALDIKEIVEEIARLTLELNAIELRGKDSYWDPEFIMVKNKIKDYRLALGGASINVSKSCGDSYQSDHTLGQAG